MTAAVIPLRPSWPPPAATASCGCQHPAHQPQSLYGPTSRFRAALTIGHAAGARLRRTDTVVTVDGERQLCEHCYLAGHDGT